jgi:acylphosphatase
MRLHVAVRGRVQGVGFRWFVRETARRLDLAGWVKNLADGSVEVAAEGCDTAIAKLRGELERGPDGAHVESVDDLSDNGDSLLKPFSILR